jgi:hypothetical protein
MFRLVSLRVFPIRLRDSGLYTAGWGRGLKRCQEGYHQLQRVCGYIALACEPTGLDLQRSSSGQGPRCGKEDESRTDSQRDEDMG